MPNLKPIINEKSTLLTQKNNTHLFVVDDVMIELNTIQVSKILEKQGLKPIEVRGIRQPSKRKTKGAKRQIKLIKRPKKFYATLAKGVIVEENLSIAF